jgi:hypothetical protein
VRRWLTALVLPVIVAVAGFVLWHQGISGIRPGQTAAPKVTAPKVAPSAPVKKTTARVKKTTAPVKKAVTPVKKATAQEDTAGSTPSPVALGVYEPSGSWASVVSFGKQAGQPLRYVLTYIGDGDPFPAELAGEAAAAGAEPVVQFRPEMSMAQVAAGDDDAYLSSLIEQVREFGHPVILSFAPEANGNWYQYGWTNTPPAQYQAAWTHVMSLAAGVGNLTWMETLNINYDGSAPLSEYVVPGVGIYGLDGYYGTPEQSTGAGTGTGSTFDSVFGATLSQLRQLTSAPIMISETGVPQGYQAAAIPGLLQGVRDNHLAGVIYLNADIDGGSWAMTPAGFAALRAS